MPAARHGLVRANLVLEFHSVDRSQDGGLGELRRQPGAVAAMGAQRRQPPARLSAVEDHPDSSPSATVPPRADENSSIATACSWLAFWASIIGSLVGMEILLCRTVSGENGKYCQRAYDSAMVVAG
jgi:hypothetical protein